MTPQFTTPCYVQVDDPKKRKEVCEKLEPIGYKIKVDYTDDINPIVIASKLGILHDASSIENPKFIDCGTNIDLFLALAGMRSDTDMGQWFIDKESRFFQCQRNEIRTFIDISAIHGYEIGGNWFRRATATEIVEHHNNK